MASYTANSAKSFSTAVGTADDTTLTSYGAVVQVVHRGTADPIYFTLGVDAASTPNPTIAGDNCFVVLPGQVATVPWPLTSVGARLCVETISATAQGCTVQVLTARAF